MRLCIPTYPGFVVGCAVLVCAAMLCVCSAIFAGLGAVNGDGKQVQRWWRSTEQADRITTKSSGVGSFSLAPAFLNECKAPHLQRYRREAHMPTGQGTFAASTEEV
jgi:hypothetical protein